MQKILNQDQVAAFYHDEFVTQQVAHFLSLLGKKLPAKKRVIVDIGGGVGHFAEAIQREISLPTRVIDTDRSSIAQCTERGVEAFCENGLEIKPRNDEGVVCFNLVLHHLIAPTERDTATLQKHALSQWREQGVQLFVNEYIYESWLPGFSGWAIYQITKSKVLSQLGLLASKIAPSLKANTFGVGVRFRSNAEWRGLFKEAGYRVADEIKGEEEKISLPRRVLLIKSIRRDSFLLEKAV